MESTSRLFVALPVEEPARAGLAAFGERARRQIAFRKWVHPQDYHITLVFLGDTEGQTAARVAAVLEEIAARHRAFPLAWDKPGCFGLAESPRVLWTAVQGDLPALRLLQRDVADRMKELGFPPENRPYRPHITLARQYAGGGDARPALEALEASAAAAPGGWEARRLVLFRTRMGHAPMYEIVREAALEADGHNGDKCHLNRQH